MLVCLRGGESRFLLIERGELISTAIAVATLSQRCLDRLGAPPSHQFIDDIRDVIQAFLPLSFHRLGVPLSEGIR